MSKQRKRLRQINILESFSLSKKLKKTTFVTLDMDKKGSSNPCVRNLSAEAAEKRIAKSSQDSKSDVRAAEKAQSMEMCEQSSSTPIFESDEEDDICSIISKGIIYKNPSSHKIAQNMFRSHKTIHRDSSSPELNDSNLSSQQLNDNNPSSQKLNQSSSQEIFSNNPDSQEAVPSYSGSQELFPNISSSESEEKFTEEEIIFLNSDNLDMEENNVKLLNFPDSSSHSANLFPKFKHRKVYEKQNLEETSECPSADESTEIQSPQLNRTPDCSLPLPKLTPTESHSIMFSPHIRPGDAPRPYPAEYRDRWDVDHVRMPCSPQNKFPIEDQLGGMKLCNRWDLISESLRSGIKSSSELEQAILKYNTQHIGRWNFKGLHFFINRCLEDQQREQFFCNLLPKMIDLALQLPYICTQSIPLLKKQRDHSLTMSQKQIACLLLNAFFCTFPRRNLPSKHSKQRWNSEYFSYPDINFNRLFEGTRNGISKKNAEKFKCLINYFIRVVVQEPSGTVTFHRQYLQRLPHWTSSTDELRLTEFHSDGMIETDGYGMLQVDFANKFVGGGVLGSGCVQEEIRFVICPELIISRLFTESLGATEVLIITGVEQYNKYKGYGDEFTWRGEFEDETPRDSWGRRYTQLVAMDAIYFSSPDEQYKLPAIKRELNKAFCGFYEENVPSPNLAAVATGNWGCGAFNGTPNLKFLIQLMAASQAGRNTLYFTFGSKKLENELQGMYTFLKERHLTVGDLWKYLETYSSIVMPMKKELRPQLYEYLYTVISEHEHDNSEEQAIRNLIKDVESTEENSTDIEDSVPNTLNDHG